MKIYVKRGITFLLMLFLCLLIYQAPAQITSLPFFEGFEGQFPTTTNDLPWTIENADENNPNTMCHSTEFYEGIRSFRFSSYDNCESENYIQYLISPEIDIENQFFLSFMYKTHGYVEYFSIGYSSTDNEISSFTWGATQSCQLETWENFEEMAPAGTKYIAIRYNSNYSYYLYIDNFTLSLPPTCIKPANIQVSNITANSASFSWTAGANEIGWRIVASPTQLADPQTGINNYAFTNPNFEISDLLPNTRYYIYIQSYCSDDDQSIWINSSFETMCSSFEIPFSENFDSYEWGDIIPCWTLFSTDNNEYNAPEISTINASPENSLQLSADNEYSMYTSYAVLPELNADIRTLQISFNVYKESYYSEEPPLEVGVMTNPNDISTFVSISSVSTASDIWDEVNYSFASYEGTGRYIAFKLSATSTNYINIDDIEVNVIESCQRPEIISFANILSNSIDIAWTPNGEETAWDLVVSNVDLANPSTGTIINTEETTYTATGLNANTMYYIYVRANCGEDSQSNWRRATVRSGCSTYDVPFEENFDSYNQNEGITCWNLISSDGEANHTPYLNVWESASPENSLSLNAETDEDYGVVYSSYAIMPESERDLSELQISFKMSRNAYYINENDLFIGIATDPNDIETFTNLGSITPQTEWTEYTFSFANYEGSGKYIAFMLKASYSNNVLIDDIVVEEIPSCPKPTSIAINNITQTSVDIAWTESGTATEWEVNYSINDGEIIVVNGVSATSPYTITDLTANETYTINAQVKAICSETDESEWRILSDYVINTACDIITVDSENPFIETYNEDSETINCWTVINANSDNTTWTYENESAQYTYSGSNQANDWIISPQLELSEDSKVYFDYKNYLSSYPEKFSVYIITGSAYNYATATEILPTMNITNSNYQTIEAIDLSDYTGQTVYIGIKCESMANQYYLFIDNFIVRTTSTNNDILSFRLPTQTSNSIIDTENHTVNCEVSFYTDITAQTPEITISDYATISPESNITQDFTTPVTYTVTAENGTDQSWSVNVTKLTELSNAAEITSFTFENQVGNAVINSENATVNAIAEWNADLTAITPEIEFSGMSSINPANNTEQNFTTPISYTITAEDGITTKNWTVTIINDLTACPNPIAEEISVNTASTTATFSWEQVYTETSYNIVISNTELDNPGTSSYVTINENSYTATELSPSTNYFVYIQSVCATTEWTSIVFSTQCDGFVVDRTNWFEESFETSSTSSRCWTVLNENEDDIEWEISDVNPNLGSQSYQIRTDYNDGNENDYLISPQITLNENVILEYWYRVMSSYEENNFEVLLSTTGNNPEDFTTTLVPNAAYDNESYEMNRIDLAEYNGESIYIAFHLPPNGNDGYILFIDDFSVKYIDRHEIVASAEANGSINPNGTINIIHGGNQTFTITPDPGYRIDELSVDGEIVNTMVNSYTFNNVTADHSINVTFEEIPILTITATSGENGTISPIGEIQVFAGSNKTFNLIPNEGYRIETLLVDNEETEPYGNYYVFVNIQESHTIDISYEAIPTFTISASAGEGGSITPNGDSIVYEGSNITYTITPETGYRITNLLVDEEAISVTSLVSNTYTFSNITENHSISVSFEAIPAFIITATAGEGGSINPVGEITVYEGQGHAFIMTPEPGYALSSVLVDDNEIDINTLTSNTYIFYNVTANHTIAATFEAVSTYTYTITATAQENGSITPSGEIIVNEGENQTFTISADVNYQIVSVLVDDEEAIGSLVDGVYTFSNIMADHSIVAIFAPSVSIENNEISTITTYPNPNNGRFSVNFNNIEGRVSYQISGTNGNIIETKELVISDNSTETFEYNLASGTYFIRIISDKNVYIKKIVVE